MLGSMQRPAPSRYAAGAAALAALVGAWTGHTLEYLRVAGRAGLGASLLSGVHAYMLPVGAVLALAATVWSAHCGRAWLLLGRRLDGLRAALRGALRGRVAAPSPAAAPVSSPSRLLALWLPLGTAQVALYLLQENLEAALSGAPLPGLGPVLGVHAGAAAVQLGVALVLAAALLAAGRLLAHRARTVERCERLLRLLWERLRPRPRLPAGARDAGPSAVELLGAGIWARPPPVAA